MSVSAVCGVRSVCLSFLCIHTCRNDQQEEGDDDEWVFGTVRNAIPAPRGAISTVEASQPPAAPLSSTAQMNHAEVSSPVPTGNGRQQESELKPAGSNLEQRNTRVEVASAEEEKENTLEGSARHFTESESNRLSNGIDSRPPAGEPMAVISNHSPRASALSEENNGLALPNGLGTTGQEVATSGEPSRDLSVDDTGISMRHESISEHTKELDELLKRTSVTSVLSTDNQELGGAFERIGGSSSSSDEEVTSRGLALVSRGKLLDREGGKQYRIVVVNLKVFLSCWFIKKN